MIYQSSGFGLENKTYIPLARRWSQSWSRHPDLPALQSTWQCKEDGQEYQSVFPLPAENSTRTWTSIADTKVSVTKFDYSERRKKVEVSPSVGEKENYECSIANVQYIVLFLLLVRRYICKSVKNLNTTVHDFKLISQLCRKWRHYKSGK